MNWEQRTIRSDLIANILLFIPFGFFGALNIQQRNPAHPLVSVLWLLILGIGYALALQLLQFFLPTRVPHAADAIINSIGILLGISMAAYANSQRLKRLLPQKIQFQLSPALLILALWISWAFFPYVPVLDSQQLGKGLQGIYQSHWQWELWLKYSLFWLLLFFILCRVANRNYSTGVLLVLAIFIISLKLVIYRNQIGWSEISAIPMALIIRHAFSERLNLMVILAISGVLLAIEMLWPLTFSSLNLEQIEWLPFKGFLSGSTWYHLVTLLSLSLLWSSFIYSLARLIKNYKKAAVLSLMWVIGLSLLQLFLVHKVMDITNIILVFVLVVLLERTHHLGRN